MGSDPDGVPPERVARCFLALDFEERARQALRAAQRSLHDAFDRAWRERLRWTAAAGFHWTLRFLGDVRAEQVAALRAALPERVGGHRLPALRLTRFGAFPSAEAPRVFWLGPDEGACAALFALQGELEAAVRACGLEADDKPYRPHVTIARPKRRLPSEDARALGRAFGAAVPRASIPAHEICPDALHLVQSTLGQGPPRYARLASFALA